MPISPSPILPVRRGRLLVECLVATLLLNACALVVVGLARGALRSTQTAQLTAASWALASQGIEVAVASRCATGFAVGTDLLPRLASTWTDRVQPGWRERDATVVMFFSPFAAASPTRLPMQAAWSCR